MKDKQGFNELRGKYKQKRERKKHKERLAPSARNNQSGSTETQEQPEQAPHSELGGNVTALTWIDKLRNLTTNEIAALGLLVTVIIAVIYYFQLRAMRATVEQMQTQTRLSVRPFVGLDEGPDAIQTTALHIDESGNASLTYIIRAKNYSNSPASNVWAGANLIVADDLYTVYEWQGYACGDAVIGKPDIGQILFPGRDRVFTSMPAMAKISSKHEGSRLQAWLAGCIGYRDQFGYLYRTKFMYMLYDDAGRVVVFDAPKQAIDIKGHFAPTGGAIDAGQTPKYNYGEGVYKKMPKTPD